MHVDVGTFNYGAALHTAWRGSYPVMIMAGTGPRAFPGSMRGARNRGVQWVQEPRDQGQIVRQLPAYHCRTQPGTYFKSGGSSGGWGAGAAFGAKVARPDGDVVMTTGDGYFMFGSPLPALWCGGFHKAAFLTVVFVNKSYSTGVHGLQDAYPDGVAVATGNYAGGVFDPAPNFAKLAEAANGYGELVSDPDQVGPALQRAMKYTCQGTPAWSPVAVDLFTLVEEHALAR